VGRAALDEDAIRLIEEYNPEVEFDWTRILKGQGAETRPPEPRERDRRVDRAARRRYDRGAAASTPSPALSQPPAVDDLEPELIVELEDALPVDEPALEPHAPRPADTRLGSEGLSRLRARYAEVLARISERIQDPARQEQLKSQAERLNPDTWVTDAEVSAGLEAYESVFEGLRTAIGGPSRRRRRRRRGGGHHGETAQAPADEQQTDASEGDAAPEDDQTEDL
jgi:hypothetical protein